MTFLVRILPTFSKSFKVIPVANRGFRGKGFSANALVCGVEKRGLRAFNTTANKGYDNMAGLPNESDILGKNEGREEALTEVLNIIEECDKEGKAEAAKKAAPVPEKKEERKEVVKEKEPELKKLSAAEFRAYNSMAEHMEYFVSLLSPPSAYAMSEWMAEEEAQKTNSKQHNHFRQTWTLLSTACQNNRRPANTSLKQFLSIASQFLSHLEAHHGIEEAHIFPVLARKMPQFQNTATLLNQHKEIHKGMDGLEKYIKEVRSGERELVLKDMDERMQWGEVLWKHLDEEVKTLGAENMRKYWSIEEMRRMPM